MNHPPDAEQARLRKPWLSSYPHVHQSLNRRLP